MTFEPTANPELVRAILTHPRIYPHITDDFSGPPESFAPSDAPGVYYVKVIDGGELLGLFVLTQENGVCIKVHTCLLPCAWGPRAKQAARQLAAEIWKTKRIRRIVTEVPAYNRLALKFARAAGMKPYGRNPNSIQKGGQLHDQILLGLSRPEVEPCQQP